jgi:starch synthase
MYIVMVAAECAPVAHAGGLGDVVYGLSRELEIRGHTVEIILPKYDCLRYDQIWGLTLDRPNLWVPWYDGAIHCSVWFGFVHGRRCFFIEPHSRDGFFARGSINGCPDDTLRFAFFSKAALEFMLKANKRPDIIQCHDWHTGLVPVLLFEIYKFHGMMHQRVCYTIHNFRHQGLDGERVLRATGLGRAEYYLHHDRLRDNFQPDVVNLMKGGIVYANFVTTVSTGHAWEATHTEQGWGLGHTLHIHQGKFGSVRNGVDYDAWNPEVDRFIPHRYGIESIERKYWNKEALRDRLWLRKGFKPLICYVGRLDSQKGVHLVRHALHYALANGAQFVLVGPCPDPAIAREFYHLKGELNSNPDCHLELTFDCELAHLVYAGADMIVVPSNYEPCGLVQMIALRYGTVPIVRATGGLSETVIDREFSDCPPKRRNGFVFHQPDPRGIESAMRRAIGLWHSHPQEFRDLMLNGMRYDYSWSYPGQDYSNIFDHIRHR